jgi:hypothetical protein
MRRMACTRWTRALNSDMADLCTRYRSLLVDQSTFSSMSLEEFVDAGVLPGRAAAELRRRYLPT